METLHNYNREIYLLYLSHQASNDDPISKCQIVE